MPSHFYVPVYTQPLVQNWMASTLGSESNLHLTFSSFGSSLSLLIIFPSINLFHLKEKAFTTLLCFSTYYTHCTSFILPWSTRVCCPQPCPPVANAPSPSRVRLDLPSPGVPSASTRVPSTRILSWLLASHHRSEAHYCPRPTRLLVPSKGTALPVVPLPLRLQH
jgi:hypothetical protein